MIETIQVTVFAVGAGFAVGVWTIIAVTSFRGGHHGAGVVYLALVSANFSLGGLAVAILANHPLEIPAVVTVLLLTFVIILPAMLHLHTWRQAKDIVNVARNGNNYE